MKPEDVLLVRPQQERALVKFHKMLEAGRETLVEAGIAGLTSEAIVSRAGVNISTFYKYFANRDAFVSYLAIEFIERQTATLCQVVDSMPLDAPLERVIPAMIDSSVEDWSNNPGSRALQGLFVLNPLLYAEYSRSSQQVAVALRPFMAPWNIQGSFADWERMHSVFGDCAIVLFDRAAKAEHTEQAQLITELKALAVAYFKTAVRPPAESARDQRPDQAD